ncbi:hypothetical protein ACCO45_001876 [Purpureocillium lilacinum]|uniref:Uncharacterized protein n=1 Tax=Purpureocillium lilacinum TaxID=33203 RepID=A0ACC4E9E2_PURLI
MPRQHNPRRPFSSSRSSLGVSTILPGPLPESNNTAVDSSRGNECKWIDFPRRKRLPVVAAAAAPPKAVNDTR